MAVIWPVVGWTCGGSTDRGAGTEVVSALLTFAKIGEKDETHRHLSDLQVRDPLDHALHQREWQGRRSPHEVGKIRPADTCSDPAGLVEEPFRVVWAVSREVDVGLDETREVQGGEFGLCGSR